MDTILLKTIMDGRTDGIITTTTIIMIITTITMSVMTMIITNTITTVTMVTTIMMTTTIFAMITVTREQGHEILCKAYMYYQSTVFIVLVMLDYYRK